MLPSVVAVGTSRPAWIMPRKIVAIGVPVPQAMKAWGLAAFTFSSCAEPPAPCSISMTGPTPARFTGMDEPQRVIIDKVGSMRLILFMRDGGP